METLWGYNIGITFKYYVMVTGINWKFQDYLERWIHLDKNKSLVHLLAMNMTWEKVDQ